MLFTCFLTTIYLVTELRWGSYCYTDINKIPKNHVGLVLGTSSRLQNGKVNLFFRNRILAAKQLYDADKIEYILVSGDNRMMNYNEPITMRQNLIKLGVPKDKIIMDFAGFRTLDSVIRSSKIFQQDSITIISQEFHNKRALYIAKTHNINAVAFNAKSVSFSYALNIYIREIFARVKMFIDIYITHTEPHFLGAPEVIPAN